MISGLKIEAARNSNSDIALCPSCGKGKLVRVVTLPLRSPPGFSHCHYRCTECGEEERVVQDNRLAG
jgi:transposase-like protein